MKWVALALSVLRLASTPTKTLELPEAIRTYTSWQQISPQKYSIPGHLSTLCVAPAHPGEVIEETDLHATYQFVFLPIQ
jgi:hypothetical protein